MIPHDAKFISSTGLEPCPFCENSRVGTFERKTGFFVACFACDLVAPATIDLTASIQRWNTRPHTKVSDKPPEPEFTDQEIMSLGLVLQPHIVKIAVDELDKQPAQGLATPAMAKAAANTFLATCQRKVIERAKTIMPEFST